MPYVRSNWEGLTAFNGGGKFEAGHAHSLTEVRLQRPGQSGPRGCFLHVTMETEARISYLEMVISARAVEIYVLKGGQGASGEYVHVGRLEGRPAQDHPYKYHYRFGPAELPDARVALLQLRLTPHAEGVAEIYVFRFSVLVGEGNQRHKANIAASVSSVAHLSGSTSLVTRGSGAGARPALPGPQGQGMAAMADGGQMTVGRTASQQQLQAYGPAGAMGGGEAAVVADALNDVMGKMLTVVTKKTRGYVGTTYKRTEDRIAARIRSMEERISGFEQVVGPTLERRLLNLEHVMATLNDKLSPPPRGNNGTGGSIPQEEQDDEEEEEDDDDEEEAVAGAGGQP